VPPLRVVVQLSRSQLRLLQFLGREFDNDGKSKPRLARGGPCHARGAPI